MALIKEIAVNGIKCNYHTPIIMQNNKKQTTVAISTFIDVDHYKSGGDPLRSRVDSVEIDKKYPTPKEVYTKLTESRPVKREIEGKEDEVEIIETNWYHDAVSDEG